MSERITALKQRMRNQSIVQKEDILVLFGGVILSLIGIGQFSLVLLLPYYAFWYQRSVVQYVVAVMGALVGSLVYGLQAVYFQFLLAFVLWLLITIVHLLQQNIYHYLPFLVLITVVVSQAFQFTSMIQTLFICVLSFVVTKYSIRDVLDVDSSYRVSEMVFGAIGLGLVYGFSSAFGDTYVPYILVYVFMVYARILKSEYVLLLLGVSYWLFGFEMLNTVWMVMGLFSIVMKNENRLFSVLALSLSLSMVEWNLMNLMIFSVLSLMYCITPFGLMSQLFVQPLSVDMEDASLSASKKLLSFQLQQFASIFQLIKNYYGSTYDKEVVFLDGMAKAFQTISLEIKQNFLQAETYEQKLIKVLKAYHYDVVRCKVDEYDRRGMKVILHIANLKKGEVEDVVLPLLASVVGKQVQMVECYRNYLWNGYHHMEFVVPAFFDIYTQAWKVKADEVCSGDTYSIFRHRHATVCTISDGMGVGEAAMRTSNFVTNLFQKLVLSNLSLESSVRCVNKLLQAQNQSFATLDVLYFDHKKKEVYISKSSAASTYLVREGRVIEVTGSSLPIGIIKEVEADCYCMEVNSDDLFIMTSDGIHKNVVYKWVNQMQDEDIEVCIHNELEQMDMDGVKDDVTVLIARPKG
ncbi:MAG: SpoIIE family protein phosphatase [Erysipelotrichaceae bacterium]|nr:SpoIIE family protein phosphatase [Erysipelotrichaceae bacterium]